MNTTATLKPGNQLWGIYHTDREYARVMGDPLRTVVEAPTKLAAEETAAQLGLRNRGRIPSLPKKRDGHFGFLNAGRHRQEFAP